MINGVGGIGKTSLAVRAAYDASPDQFDKIAFVSLKPRELDDDGVRDLSGFLISGLAELLNELARELGHSDITKAPEAQRPRLLHNALRGTSTLLVLDNLESLIKPDRDTVFTFVKRLPPGCKAILTARGRIGSAAEELILQKLGESAALDTLTKLAKTNAALAKAGEAERLLLYRETGGNPLLLRWTAGQIGRGSCLTISDAIIHLRSCPAGNDPLEFIFGDLVQDFREDETSVLSALAYFNLPAKVEHISDLAGCSQTESDYALRKLINRSLVVPSDEMKTFILVPLVADFLRKTRPAIVAETGDRLERRAYVLVVENGYEKHDQFPRLDANWPTVAAALPLFLSGPNVLLQTVCNALVNFLNFTGRWDEWLALSSDAESHAVANGDLLNAGWRAHHAGWIHHLRGQSAEVLICAERAETYWHQANAGTRERAIAIRLRGLGHQSAKNYSAAVTAYHESVELVLTLGRESSDIAMGLNDLANVERLLGDLDGAERDYREALRISRLVKDHQIIASVTGNLAELMLDRADWPRAEALRREALLLSEELGRLELIAENCYRLARALIRQNKETEAFPYALRAVEIYARLDSPELEAARIVLAECED